MNLPLKVSSLSIWHVHVVAITGAAAFAAGAYFLFVAPALGRGEQSNARLAELAAQQAELTSLSISNKDAQTALAAATNAVQSGSVKLQTRDHLNQRLADLTQLATQSALQIDQLAPGKSSDGPRHGTVTIHFSGKGPYRACETFLAACAKKYPDIAVISLAASSNPEIPESPVFLTIDLLWFIASDKPVPAR